MNFVLWHSSFHLIKIYEWRLQLSTINPKFIFEISIEAKLYINIWSLGVSKHAFLHVSFFNGTHRALSVSDIVYIHIYTLLTTYVQCHGLCRQFYVVDEKWLSHNVTHKIIYLPLVELRLYTMKWNWMRNIFERRGEECSHANPLFMDSLWTLYLYL